MDVEDVLTNDFRLRYDEENARLLIYSTRDEESSNYPIEIRLETLEEMGAKEACRFVGERILVLIPTMRTSLFKVGKPE